ncbi:MAG: hypothetical protein JSS23_12425 [Proteobacteria bacterium]|nr:hypothetical protein [Pseudomonadota bacterium]
MAPQSQQQPELFAIEQVQGYAQLDRRTRLFTQAIFDGCSQAEAARRAGYEGTEANLYAAASRQMRTAKVQKVLNQAWVKSGASIDLTLRQAAEAQARAFNAWRHCTDRKDRKQYFDEWQKTSTLIAMIHGKIGFKIENHATTINHVILTPSLQEELVRQRREVVTPLTNPRAAA